MMKQFDPNHKRLVFSGSGHSLEYWDDFWKSQTPKDLRKFIESHRDVRWVRETTSQYLEPKDGKILEGGCGRGQWVYNLKAAGYSVVGLDFAPQTIQRVKESMPELEIVEGDVAKLPFPNSHFAGYWSFGVIEHFVGGYSQIVAEAARVIKPGGYLFITFPVMSPLRKLKALLGKYPVLGTPIDKVENFYQFALAPEKVIADVEAAGFSLATKRPMDGVKGMKDEVALLNPVMKRIYEGKSLPLRLLRAALNIVLSPFSSHIVLLVFRRL